jgi:hypothetical protein
MECNVGKRTNALIILHAARNSQIKQKGSIYDDKNYVYQFKKVVLFDFSPQNKISL